MKVNINDAIERLITKYQDDLETLALIEIIIAELELIKFGKVNPQGI